MDLEFEKKKLQEQAEHIAKLEKIKEQYPDLTTYNNRWKNQFYCSKLIIPECDRLEFRHSCGCCPDSPLYAQCFKEIDGIKIYGDPVQNYVGEQFSYANRWEENWKEGITKLGYNAAIINLMQESADRDAKEVEEIYAADNEEYNSEEDN